MTQKKTTTRKPRRKMPKTLFWEALENDDNVGVLKAQRLMLFETLTKRGAELEPREEVSIQTNIVNINKEIIKLEGANEEAEEEVKTARDTDEAVRRALSGDFGDSNSGE